MIAILLPSVQRGRQVQTSRELFDPFLLRAENQGGGVLGIAGKVGDSAWDKVLVGPQNVSIAVIHE